MNLFRTGINEAIRLLSNGHSLLYEEPPKLPSDRWSSAVNSGDLKLFSFDEVNTLNRVYSFIRYFNRNANDLLKDDYINLCENTLIILKELSKKEWFKDP